jgi:1,3-beta-glucanosyltransferase GAS1
MKNYNALKTQVLAARPSSTAMSAYTPTNQPAACPDLTSAWQANSKALPPTPDTTTCDCMFSTLSCVPKASLATTKYGDIFGFICAQPGNPCSGISGNTSTGVYGAFSMCNDTQKLGYVLNEYYKLQKFANSACDFTGQATVVRPGAAAQSCAGALSSASAQNSIAATATSAPSASSKNEAGGVAMGRVFSLGEFAVGAYLMIAMGVGAGMVML